MPMIRQILITVTDEVFISRLRAGLNAESLNRGKALMGYPRSSVKQARAMQPPPRESAVMMLLYPVNQVWMTVFMKRPEGGGVHSGQLSFPGGKLENNESHLDAALRETMEETGFRPEAHQVIGALNEIYIPPSHFVVAPFVACLDQKPIFTPNPSEVVELIEFPIENFLRPDIILEKEIFIPTMNRHIQARYFDVNGHTLWGATAMMVQEFREVFGVD